MLSPEAALLTIITAATPLLLAALGELVAERSGVLNLGVEGMMAVGAAAGFAAATITDSSLIGVLAAVLAGTLLSLAFGVLAISLATNQVATGLALALLGIGLANLMGNGFVGVARNRIAALEIPGLSDLPGVGRVLFGQDPIVYLSLALTAGVWWLLRRSRAGLVLRAVGDAHEAAHALGHNVHAVRYAATAFGGACAGLAGGYLSLVYTPLWADYMTAGRGWIALALVVFSSWMPWRVLAGAYLFGGVTILQFYAQGAGVPIPSQALSALPYLATILVLVVISRDQLRQRANTPACLGRPFVPER